MLRRHDCTEPVVSTRAYVSAVAVHEVVGGASGWERRHRMALGIDGTDVGGSIPGRSRAPLRLYRETAASFDPVLSAQQGVAVRGAIARINAVTRG